MRSPELAGGATWTYFSRTPAIAPHLVSLTVFDLLDAYPSEMDNQIVLYVARGSLVSEAARTTMQQATLMLTALKSAMGWLPSPKLDLVAVPRLQWGPISSPGLTLARY